MVVHVKVEGGRPGDSDPEYAVPSPPLNENGPPRLSAELRLSFKLSAAIRDVSTAEPRRFGAGVSSSSSTSIRSVSPSCFRFMPTRRAGDSWPTAIECRRME